MARRVREVHVEAAARCVVGWKRQAKKPLLTAGDDLGRGERQKIGRLQHAVDDNTNPSTLLDNVLNGGVGWILDEGERRRRTRDVNVRTDLCESRRRAGDEQTGRKNSAEKVSTAE